MIAFIAVLGLVGTLATSAGAQPAFMEDFEDGNVAGWVASTPGPSGNGTFEAVTSPVSPSGGNYVGRQTFGSSCIGWGYGFGPVSPDYISWYFRADGDGGNQSGVEFVILDDIGGWLAEVGYHNGALHTWDGGSGYVDIMPASMGTWYLIELKNIDWDNNTFDIWVDGVERLVGNPFETPVDYVRYFYNYACPWASGPSYVDDITFGFENEGPVVTSLSDAHLWVGLKNSDDQNTRFDVQVELLQNGTPVASGLQRCITGVTRNPSRATEAIVSWDAFPAVTLGSGDVLALRVSTRIGTNPDGTKCTPGHSNAVGLRLYYDATNRQSSFGATITPDASTALYLRSNGNACVNAESTGVTDRILSPIPPNAGSAKCKDSASVNFAGGNPFVVMGTWSLPPEP